MFPTETKLCSYCNVKPADDLGEAWARGVAARGGRVVRVTYPRTANNDKELTVVRGEYLEVSPRPASRARPGRRRGADRLLLPRRCWTTRASGGRRAIGAA